MNRKKEKYNPSNFIYAIIKRDCSCLKHKCLLFIMFLMKYMTQFVTLFYVKIKILTFREENKCLSWIWNSAFEVLCWKIVEISLKYLNRISFKFQQKNNSFFTSLWIFLWLVVLLNKLIKYSKVEKKLFVKKNLQYFFHNNIIFAKGRIL